MKRKNRIWAGFLSAIIAFSLIIPLTACSGQKLTDTMIIGNGQMTGVFSPFFSETANDQLVVKLTSLSLLRPDVNGTPVPYGADFEIIEDIHSGGQVLSTTYRFRLQEGLRFSDGEPVTADDVVFSIKVLCDPTYNGLSPVSSLPILGLQEYKYDRADYEEVVASLADRAEDPPASFVEEYILKMAKADVGAYAKEDVAAYLGIELDPTMKDEELFNFLVDAYYEFERENSYDYYIEGAGAAYLEAQTELYLTDEDPDSVSVPDISGVRKIDERTVDVTILGGNPAAIWQLGEIVIAPEHYYCGGEPQGKFVKARLDGIREFSGDPLGAGPYIYEEYANNVVTLKSNENYLFGKPSVPKIKVAASNAANTLDAILLSEIDIAQIPATEENLKRADEKGLGAFTVNFPGYGYIGINSGNIPDKNLRKGLMCLMNREPAVSTYFGSLANIIERPVSSSSFVYPKEAKTFYRYDPEQALAYFLEAGYEQTTENGKPLLIRDGVQLALTAGVGGEGTMDHPAALVFSQMKSDLESMGGKFEIIDTDMSVLVEGLYQGSWDLWAASWELPIDPDMRGRYMTGAEGNYYGLANEELDRILNEAVSISRIEARKELYQRGMDIIMDEAVELPLYQRKNLLIYNKNVIDSASMPEEMTEFYNYLDEIHKIRLSNQ